MGEIAYTSFGRNVLVAGLSCHAAAILAGMLSASGADVFFKMVYPASWVLLMAGGYKELRQRGIPPLSTWRFYLIAIASVFPLLGPLVVLGLIYSAPINKTQTGGLSGLFPAILKLRASALMILVLLLGLFLLFAFLHIRSDSYYNKFVRGNPLLQVLPDQMVK